MKAYSFENWIIDSKTTPFLFFIQSVEEMLFPYGHDSYKVPTLNENANPPAMLGRIV